VIYFKSIFFCIALFLITLLSCNKEVEIAQSVATFELYSPEQHDMNQNGLFFIERSFDKSFITLFGFDINAQNKFKIRLGIESFIQNSQSYDTIRVNKLLVDEKVFLMGDATKNDSLVIFINEIDQFNGDLINYYEFFLPLPTDSIQFLEYNNFPVTECTRDLNFMSDIVKSSYGYEVLIFGRFGYDQKIKRIKVDLDFNIIEIQDHLIYSEEAIDTLDFNNHLHHYCIYNDAILTDNDQLTIGYYKLPVIGHFNLSNPGPNSEQLFMIHSFDGNSVIWFKELSAIYDYQGFSSTFNWFDKSINNNIMLKKLNNEILAFSKTSLNTSFNSAPLSLTPSMCFFDINSGELTYYKIIDYEEPSYDSYFKYQGTLFVPNNIDFNELKISVFNENDIIVSGYKGTEQNSSSSMIHYKRRDTVSTTAGAGAGIEIVPINVNNKFLFQASITSRFYYLGIVNQNTYLANGLHSPLFGFVSLHYRNGRIKN